MRRGEGTKVRLYLGEKRKDFLKAIKKKVVQEVHREGRNLEGVWERGQFEQD